MTYKEKLIKEHPEMVLRDGWHLGCPVSRGYEDNPYCPGGITCEECWDREIPEGDGNE